MIPHNLPTLGKSEKRAATRVISSKIVSSGNEVLDFEDRICDHFQIEPGCAISFSSGSAALYVALYILGAKARKVTLPSYTCNAVLNAIRLAEGIPEFIDLVPDSPNSNYSKILNNSSNLVVAVSTFGIPAEVSPENSNNLIEDISQAIGTKITKEKFGLRGKAGIFSLSATKMITSGGQGGMLISEDRDFINLARDYKNFDGRTDSNFRFNFLMTEIQAAIGKIQLKRLPEFIEKRAAIFAIYQEENLDLISSKSEENQIANYRAVIRTKKPLQLIEGLRQNGISAIVPFTPAETLKKDSVLEHTSNFSSSTVSLPIYPNLKLRDALRIARLTKELLLI